MNANHTKGPWYVTGKDSGPARRHLHIGAKDSPMVLASMNEVHVDTPANARLIAAAPDLLAALEGASEVIVQLRGYMLSIANGELGPIDIIEFLRNRVHEIEAVDVHARAAISKATGA